MIHKFVRESRSYCVPMFYSSQHVALETQRVMYKSELVFLFIFRQCPLFLDSNVRICLLKLKAGMFNQKNNNTVSLHVMNKYV